MQLPMTRTVLRILGVLALYALLTAVLTWPLVRRLGHMEPGDSAYFAWVMAWEIHSLKTDPLGLPHGNIFHPARYTLGMDEPVLGTMLLVLPVSLFTDDAVLLFNLARLLTFLLSAFTAYLLARELGCGQPPALLAGALFAFSPIRTDRIAHLSVLGTQWLPLVLLFLVRFSRSGRARHASLAGGFFALSAYACGYLGLIGLLVLPAAAIPLLWGRWRRLWTAVPALALAALALLPLRALHRAAFETEGFSRSYEETVFYTASLEGFLATSSSNRLYGEVTASFRTAGGNNLFPGLVIPSLALAGALGLVRRRRAPSREALALGLLALAAALVALGPEVRLAGRTLFPGPVSWIREAIPMFQGVRVMGRGGMYLALALTSLAGLGLESLRPRRALLGCITAAALLETLIVPIPEWVRVIDSSRPPPAVYSWLASQPGDFAIVELPLLPADGRFMRPAFEETVYMVRSTLHWKRLVNGDAGMEPACHRRATEACDRFPSAECVALLRELGVRYAILHSGGYGPNKRARLERELPAFASSLRPVQDLDGVVVLEFVGSHAR